jgi:uncharacterized protein (DUF2236 family)
MIGGGAAATESSVRRIGGEGVLMLGAGRALLAQAAHPCVAAGIVGHSRYEQEPWRRLGRTMSAVYTVVFGTEQEADRAARHVRAVHRRVSGRLHESVGRFPAGTTYSALDPDLATWVHATMVENALAMYELLVGPLSAADEEAFWEDMKAVADTFGVPRSALPRHAQDFRAYWREMLAGDVLAVGSDARKVAAVVLALRVPPPLRPARRVFRALTVTTLAPELRALYGIRVSRRDRVLAASAPALRGVLPLVPSRLRRVSDRRGRAGLPLVLLRALAE